MPLEKQEAEWMDSEDTFIDHVRVKEELLCEASCVDAYELYADHVVKDELVLGPERPHRPHVGLTSRCWTPAAQDVGLQESPQSVRGASWPALTDCFVRLERLLPETNDLGVKDTIRPKRNTQNHTKVHCMATNKPSTKKQKLNVKTKQIKKQKRTKKQSFICDTCGKVCKFKHTLIQHFRYHLPDTVENLQPSNIGHKPYSCEICEKDLACLTSLKRHLNIHAGKKRHSCEVCGHIGKPEFDIEVKVEPLCLDSVTASLHEQVTKDKLVLEPVEPNQDIHLPVRENIDSVHTLRDCFVRLERLTHTQAFCTDVPVSNTDVATPQQRDASHTRTTGKREMKTTHNKDRNYECDTCSKIFEIKSNLTKHIQQHMQKQKTNENSQTFKQHMCELCGQQFAQISHLNRHNRIHTDKKYSCKICKKSYTRLNNLRDHKMVHTRQKPYSCKTCKKQFNQRRSLRMHVRIHTGEKPYLCEVCNTGFARPSNFKRHMITHTGEMPYSCEICSKKFFRVSSLNEHTQVHTGKKHRCAVCERQFMRLATLKNHEKKYHK